MLDLASVQDEQAREYPALLNDGRLFLFLLQVKVLSLISRLDS